MGHRGTGPAVALLPALGPAWSAGDTVPRAAAVVASPSAPSPATHHIQFWFHSAALTSTSLWADMP